MAYYRMTDKPASTLLHLGPGLANTPPPTLHKRQEGRLRRRPTSWASTRLYHIKYDTPLTADIEGIARPFSHWVKTSPTSKTVAGDGALAIQAAARGAGPDRPP